MKNDKNDIQDPREPLFGLCPMCNTPLVFNSKNITVQCPNPQCSYFRLYSISDRQAMDGESEAYFRRLMKWDEIYGGYQSSVNSRLKDKQDW